MNGKRITAENAEQLLTIVKAVQNGEEPDEALRREEEARAQAEAQAREEARARQEEQARERAQAREEARARRKGGAGRKDTAVQESDGQEETASGRETPEESGEPEGAVSKKTDSGREEPPWAGFVRKNFSRKDRVKEPAKPEDGDWEDDPSWEGSFGRRERTAAERDLVWLDDPDWDEDDGEKKEAPSRLSGLLQQLRQRVGARTGGGRQTEKKKRQKDDGGGTSGKKPNAMQLALQDCRERLQETAEKLMENLAQKGIHKRELCMIGLGLLLAVIVVILIVNAVRASLEERRKQEHVTADPGFVVTVEREPEAWCSSALVELGLRAKQAEITRVTVDGQEIVPDEKGRIQVEAEQYLLEVDAETSEGTLHAQVEIPLLDAQPPVVNLTREDDRIAVTAADARSKVTAIRYAEVKRGSLTELPYYQEYSEPFLFEKDTAYYFYAEDEAGNRSEPVITTMEQPERVSLAQEELSLFPQESCYLNLQVEPEGAYLNNLVFESANPEVAAVDSRGNVTAVSNGTTVIHARADGIKELTCPVTVSDTRTVTISAIGDCTLGTDVSFNTTTNFDAFDAVNGHAWFFRNVREILENDDVTFANLEGALTTADTRENKEYAFRGSPDYTEVLRQGSVEVVTLANNHSGDYGAQGLEDTERSLTEAGIDYCSGDTIVIKEINGIPVAFIGIYVLRDGMACEDQVRETIASAQAQGAQLVVVAFHWGSEKATQPDETQQALAHTAVDCGADLVIGHHPHVLQGIEEYNGTYIVYSLGNFCFGGNSTPSDMDTMIYRQTFTVGRNGPTGKGEVEIIPCSVSSVEGYNNYQPTPAAGTEAERIIGRLNEYSAAYGQTFTASDGLS